MALPAKEALGGYILEEALAHLIRNNGYRLLEDAAHDPDALDHGGHGLLVRGRGAKHQADVLGELELPSPFTLPVRLFVEAKCRKAKCSLRDVRNAHGVISDVNEHYGTDHSKRYQQPLRRFQYRYSLFSTSGFGSDAQSFGLAQQISLVDLSGPAFQSLRETVDSSAIALRRHAQRAGLSGLSINQIRRSLRRALNNTEPLTDPELDGRSSTELPTEVARSWAEAFARGLGTLGVGETGLLLGFPSAPFVLVMRPDNAADLVHYVNSHGSDIRVEIRFERLDRPAGDWTISPVGDPDGFTLRFGLPGILEKWLLSVPEAARQRAMNAKTDLLSTISIFVERRLVRFLFEPVTTTSSTVEAQAEADEGADSAEEATDARASSELRRLLERPRSNTEHEEPMVRIEALPPKKSMPKPRQSLGVGSEIGWTVSAARQLLSRLDAGDYYQGDVLREASALGGTISRKTVLRIMRRKQTQRLNGITKPVRRIVNDLTAEGYLSRTARQALTPKYVQGTAERFDLPPDLVVAIQELQGT